MDQEGFFKTAPFGGFEKKAVLAYINTLTEKATAAEEEHRRSIEEFSKAQDSQVAYIQKLEAELTDSQGKLEAVALQLESERAAVPEHLKDADSIFEKNKQLEMDLDAAQKALNEQEERCRQLGFKLESLEFKGKKYDEVSGQIGNLLLVARADSEQILEHARTEAAGIVGRAREEAEQARFAAESEAAHTIQQANSDMEHQRAQAESDAAQTRTQADNDAERTIARAQRRAEEIESDTKTRLERFYSEIGCFKTDSGRLRRSVEEILFVLNDRVDVMQEIVRQVDQRYAAVVESGNLDLLNQEADAEQDASVPPALFEQTEDEAGLFATPLTPLTL